MSVKLLAPWKKTTGSFEDRTREPFVSEPSAVVEPPDPSDEGSITKASFYVNTDFSISADYLSDAGGTKIHDSG